MQLKHDTNVAAFIKLLGLDEPIVTPKYTASILVELRRSVRTSKYYVQIYTKNNSPDDEPINPRLAKIEGKLLGFIQKHDFKHK